MCSSDLWGLSKGEREMGYFSNSVEGGIWIAENCPKCIHCLDCALRSLLFEYNYTECNNPKSFLHRLIPYENGENGKCKMWGKRPVEQAKKECVWGYDNIDEYWATGCGNEFCFIDGGPEENGMIYCGYCRGRIIIDKEPEDE